MTAVTSTRASGTTKPYHEPEENEAQIGMLLDGHIEALDTAIERAMHYGLEAKVREVFAKHLAPPETDPAPPVTAPTPPTMAVSAGLKGMRPDQIDTLIGLLNCVQVLDDHARRTKADSPSGKRAASCRDFLRAEIEKLKGNAR